MSDSRHHSEQAQRHPRRRVCTAAVVACAGVALSIGVCWHLRAGELQNMKAVFAHESRHHVDAISDALANRLFVLEAIRCFYDASVCVDRSEFATMSTPWLGEMPDLEELAWVPRVPHEARQRFEIAAREDGMEQFQFVDRDAEGVARRAPAREEYYPLYYQEPHFGNDVALGLDLGRDRGAWPLMEQARDNDEAIAASLSLDHGDHPACACTQVFFPVYSRHGLTYSVEGRRENLLGFICCRFRIDKLVTNARARLGQGLIDIRLAETASADDPSSDAPRAITMAASVGDPVGVADSSAGLHSDATIEFGGRRWSVRCAPTPRFVQAYLSASPWFGLAGSLALTGILTAWLATLTQHTRRVEEAVQRRTAKLRESESSLREQEALLSKVVGNIPYYVFWKDRELVYRGCNDAFARAAGMRTPAQVVGKVDRDLTWWREEAVHSQECDRQVIAEGLPLLDVEERHVRPDGTAVVLLTSRVPLRDADGAVTGLLGILTDITDRKRNEEKLTALQKALDDASDAVAIVQKDGLVSYINMAFQELLRAPVDEVNTAGWQSIFVDRSVATTCVETVMNLDNWTAEVELRSRDGREFPAEVRGTPIVDELLMPTGILLFIHDIAPRKQAERELKEHAQRMENLNARLQHAYAEAEEARYRVELANAELTKAHLDAQEARVRAEQAKEALEATQQQLLDASRQAGMAEVATGVLHNVGNVLNSVNVSAGLVVEQATRSKLNNLVKVVALLEENGERLGDFMTADTRGQQLPAYLAKLTEHLQNEQRMLVSELQELTTNIDHIRDIVSTQQCYAGSVAVIQSFPLEQVLEDALRMSGGDFGRHGITVVREFADVADITADRQKVLQILINLVRNARHALAENAAPEPRLVVRLSASDEGTVRAEVSDNGVGIAPEHLGRIFSHGFTTKKDGHGFGLHHSVLLAQQMGGSLKAHSDGPGRGATFTLELPIEHAEGNP